MQDEFAFLDATAQADLVRSGQVSALELVDAAIARIERINPKINAVITTCFEAARDLARSAHLPDGPFHGVPFLIKDLDVFVENQPFHGGTTFLKDIDWHADHDSYLVGAYKRAGLVALGKTNTPEFGLTITTEPRSYGPSHNPWNLEHSTGGSSGGSAAAVASGLVPLAHAGDGGGSIRIPSSECGLVGLKPSRGRISHGPDYGEYWSGLVTSHVLSRSVRDSARMLDLSAGYYPGDPYVAPAPHRPYEAELGDKVGKLRIGFLNRHTNPDLSMAPDCAEAVDKTAKLLTELGHQVEEAYPAALDEFGPTTEHFMNLVASWVRATLDAWGDKIGRQLSAEDVEPGTWMLAEIGATITAAQYIATVQWMHSYTRRMAAWWEKGFDLLLTPTIGVPPPRLGELVPPADDPAGALMKALPIVSFVAPFNMTGQPAISLPLHWNGEGLPIGVQFVAAYGREDVLIRLAAQLEKAAPWSDRHPLTVIVPALWRLSVFERKEFFFDFGEEVEEAIGKVSPLAKGGLRGVNPLGRYLCIMHSLNHALSIFREFISWTGMQRLFVFQGFSK